MNAESIEEMEKIAKGDDVMEQAIAYVDQFLKEEGTTFQDKIEYEKAKSEAKGRAEEHEKMIKAAKNMLQDGISMKAIIKYTGLSKQDIENIKQEC